MDRNMNFKNMDMKTKVKMISEVHQCGFKIGEKGYIDGYVQAADKRPYACVVIGVRIELVPMYALEVIE